jgi:hypothetical protein
LGKPGTTRDSPMPDRASGERVKGPGSADRGTLRSLPVSPNPALLHPRHAEGLLDVYALSTKINSSRVEGIELLTPLHG